MRIVTLHEGTELSKDTFPSLHSSSPQPPVPFLSLIDLAQKATPSGHVPDHRIGVGETTYWAAGKVEAPAGQFPNCTTPRTGS